MHSPWFLLRVVKSSSISAATEFRSGLAMSLTFPAAFDIDMRKRSSRSASDLLGLAMEVCGGVACLDEFGLIRHHNDLFVTRVGEGSNFALKDLIVRPLRG